MGSGRMPQWHNMKKRKKDKYLAHKVIVSKVGGLKFDRHIYLKL